MAGVGVAYEQVDNWNVQETFLLLLLSFNFCLRFRLIFLKRLERKKLFTRGFVLVIYSLLFNPVFFFIIPNV